MRVFFMFLLTAAICQADYYVEFVWYRVEPDLSRIVISWEHLRGRKAVDGFVANKEMHEAEGRFLAQDYESGRKTFVQEEQLDGHTIETQITIRPSPKYGPGREAPEVQVTVFFDGVEKIDCPFGFRSVDFITVPKIVIYAEGESTKVDFRNELKGNSREVWNFFDIGHTVIVFEDGKLFSKPNMIVVGVP